MSIINTKNIDDKYLKISLSILSMNSNFEIGTAIRLFKLIIHKITSERNKNASFRIRHYNDAIKILEKWDGTHCDDMSQMEAHFKSNGKKNPAKIISKLTELFETGKMVEAEEALKDPKVRAVINLCQVYGIGPAKANELWEKYEIDTVDKLKAKFKIQDDIIHGKQAIGLKYFDDLQERIPRNEVDAYNIKLKSICSSISSSIIMSINGSYRRGLPTSGDIDLMITSKTEDSSKLRKLLIKELTKQGIIKATMASGKKKFMGVVKLESEGFHKARHLDIIDTSPLDFPFAVLYFTGSGGFNSKMRAEALKLGYSMNEYCLSDKNTKVRIDSEIIQDKIGKDEFESEEDIFKFLDMKYVKPENRNIMTLSKQ